MFCRKWPPWPPGLAVLCTLYTSVTLVDPLLVSSSSLSTGYPLRTPCPLRTHPYPRVHHTDRPSGPTDSRSSFQRAPQEQGIGLKGSSGCHRGWV